MGGTWRPTRMLFGDAKKMVDEILTALRADTRER
jgi:hypothetical protein